MKSYKYVTSLAMTTGLLCASVTSLYANPIQTLKPSLMEQMERQNTVNEQYAQTKAYTQWAEQLRLIRERNLQRLAEQQSIASQRDQESVVPIVVPVIPPPVFIPPPVVPTPTVHEDIIVAGAVIPVTQDAPQYIGNIDMARVQNAWLEWNNNLRKEMGLAPYTLHPSLNQTAQEWSEFSRDRGYITHGRPGDGCTGARNWSCYNYNAVDTWFRDRGVNPVPVARTKHTENLGFGAFNCTASDCTEQAIQAIRKTYNFFYSEKSYNGVHYRSMVNPRFQRIGVGLAHKNGTYYLTVHYATDF